MAMAMVMDTAMAMGMVYMEMPIMKMTVGEVYGDVSNNLLSDFNDNTHTVIL